jgi:hypothetical protein
MTKKGYSINIRVSKETEAKARQICLDFKARYGIEVTITSYLRGIIDTLVAKRFEEIEAEKGSQK